MAEFLPPTFVPPDRTELATGHHIRPIRPSDIDLDYPAVMNSQPRLFEIFGPAWGWPEADTTHEDDLNEIIRHANEMVTLQSFNYAIFDRDETALLGCIYVDPPERVGADAEVSWWVVDSEVGGALEATLRDEVPAWIGASWPFVAPRFIGEQITWAEWIALPKV
jgi:RimJ/RimL family protein N-acetyltransferase